MKRFVVAYAPLAQSVEHETFNLVVLGSIPRGRTIFLRGRKMTGFLVSFLYTWIILNVHPK